MDDSFNLDLETLRSFVSDEIFDFLSSTNMDSDPPTCSLDDPTTSHASIDLLDAHVDALLLAGSQRFEESLEPETKRQRLDVSSKTATKKRRIFAAPKTEKEVAEAKQAAVPAKTLADNNYCVGVWREWRDHRLAVYSDNMPPIEQLSPSDLASNLSSFIFEVRKKNGEEFPPKTLHHIVCGIQRHLRMNVSSTVDFFKDSEFADFRVCLDSEMKRLQKAGHGSKTRKAEPLTTEEEELLWTKGLLGKGSPQALVDTILVMNGIYFALRSGSEHRQLRADPCQITLHERPGQRPYLEYVEDISKNRSGGLKGRKLKPKIVQHHNNPTNPERCFVELFKLYQKMCPANRPKDSFYLQPLEKPTPTCWFSCRPIGHNKLEGTVARLCRQAGIEGYRTNHSLRATAATRLYQSGIDEQLVMERTGHRSLDGVRGYKHTSTIQKETISDILNCSDKNPNSLLPLSSSIACSSSSLSSGSQIVSNNSQCLAMTLAQSPPTLNFHGCTVTVNFNSKQ